MRATLVYDAEPPPDGYLGWTFLATGWLWKKYWAVMTIQMDAGDPLIRLARSIDHKAPLDEVSVPGPERYFTIVKRARRMDDLFIPAEDTDAVIEREWPSLKEAVSGHRDVVSGIILGVMRPDRAHM